MQFWLLFKPSVLFGFPRHLFDRVKQRTVSLLLGRCRSPGSLLRLCWYPRLGFCQNWEFWLFPRPPLMLPRQRGAWIPHYCSSRGIHWLHGGRSGLLTAGWRIKSSISPRLLTSHRCGERKAPGEILVPILPPTEPTGRPHYLSGDESSGFLLHCLWHHICGYFRVLWYSLMGVGGAGCGVWGCEGCGVWERGG